jgi:hypothetical protein
VLLFALQRPDWSAVRWLLVDGVSGDVLQVRDPML